MVGTPTKVPSGMIPRRLYFSLMPVGQRSGRHIISNPHPIADRFEPLWALSDQSGELERR
jgi:hypothetical protein